MVTRDTIPHFINPVKRLSMGVQMLSASLFTIKVHPISERNQRIAIIRPDALPRNVEIDF